MKIQHKNSTGRGKIVAALVIYGVVLIGVASRFIFLNTEYPSPQIKTYSLGETICLGNYNFTLKEWKWQDGEIVHELLPGYHLINTFNGKEYPVEKERVGLATVIIEKTHEDDTYLDLTDITFESGAWGNQWDQDIMFGINKGLDSLLLDMKEGECREIIFPITMADFHFAESDWREIDRRDFYIVLEYYPVKYQLLCEN